MVYKPTYNWGAPSCTSKVIFLQTDIMTGGQWIDKAALICKEADAAGGAPLGRKGRI